MADSEKRAEIGLVAAISIGVGGMIGAGVFSILGVVASISGSAMPISGASAGGRLRADPASTRPRRRLRLFWKNLQGELS